MVGITRNMKQDSERFIILASLPIGCRYQTHPACRVVSERGKEMRMENWLVWDSGNGIIEEYKTEEEALKFANETLDLYREEAKDEGEWSYDAECVAVYKLTHYVKIVDQGGDFENDEADWIEYGIVPV